MIFIKWKEDRTQFQVKIKSKLKEYAPTDNEKAPTDNEKAAEKNLSWPELPVGPA